MSIPSSSPQSPPVCSAAAAEDSNVVGGGPECLQQRRNDDIGGGNLSRLRAKGCRKYSVVIRDMVNRAVQAFPYKHVVFDLSDSERCGLYSYMEMNEQIRHEVDNLQHPVPPLELLRGAALKLQLSVLQEKLDKIEDGRFGGLGSGYGYLKCEWKTMHAQVQSLLQKWQENNIKSMEDTRGALIAIHESLNGLYPNDK